MEVIIKEGYISYKKNGLDSFEFSGGFNLINDKPKQIKFTKSRLKNRIKELQKDCVVYFAEIITYKVENNEYAELIDPIKTETIFSL